MKIKSSLYFFLFWVSQISQIKNDITVIEHMKMNDVNQKKNESFWIHPGFVADPVSHVPTQPDGRVSCGVSDYAIHHLFFG